MKKYFFVFILISTFFVYLVYKNSTAKNNLFPVVSEKDHILGSPSAQLVLVEYSDLECPYCINFHKTMQQVMKDYTSQVAWVFRHYPLSFHANAQKEAEAAECAASLGDKNAFWQYIDAIYSQTQGGGTGFPLDKLVPLAKKQGLDETKFKQCLDSGQFARKVKDNQETGSQIGVQGTPMTFMIAKNGKQDIIGGALPFDQVKVKIDALLR